MCITLLWQNNQKWLKNYENTLLHLKSQLNWNIRSKVIKLNILNVEQFKSVSSLDNKTTFGTNCTITVIICSYMLLALYVREANVEPHASPSLFYAYYAWACLNTASSRCSYSSPCRPYNETVISRRTWLIFFTKTTLIVLRECRLSCRRNVRATRSLLGSDIRNFNLPITIIFCYWYAM